MVGWNSCAQEAVPVLHWLECHPGSTGWAQDFVTLLAVGFAYWLGRKHVRLGGERQAAKIQALAARLSDVMSEVDRVRDVILRYEHGMALVTRAKPSHASAVDRMTIHVSRSDMILQSLDELPPTVVASLIRLFFKCVDDFNASVSEFLPQTYRFDVEARAAFVTDINRRFARVVQATGPIKDAVIAIGTPSAPRAALSRALDRLHLTKVPRAGRLRV